jgi:hypothetical protein
MDGDNINFQNGPTDIAHLDNVRFGGLRYFLYVQN